jgi:D-alanyl-D-alanine carboxypeptidase/D-alanyl-D-alanine-endopeptidase (penicillin-binding protein 4)
VQQIPKTPPPPAQPGRRRALGALLGSAAAPLAWAYPGPLTLPGRPVPEILRYSPVLPPEVQATLAASGLPPEAFGLHLVPVAGRGQPLASVNAESPFKLASTTKVVTSLAALDLLGPQYRWRTCAFIDGPLQDGKLLGDLLIVGGGDASLTAVEMLAWFQHLQRQGLQEVWGDIVLDRFAFRLQPDDHHGTPQPVPERPHHALPDALMLDEGVVRVSVHADVGQAPQVSLQPPMAGLRVVNELRLGRACSAAVHVDRQDGESRVVVRGQWSAACGHRELAHLALPHEEYTVHAVNALWREAGGRLKGRVLDKRAPDRDTLYPLASATGKPLKPFAEHLSAPLPVVVRDINKTSDNLAARNLMLSLSQGFPQRAATLPQARARLAEWLRRQGLAAGDIEVDNGSGLSAAERGKPRALVQLLRHAWHAQQGRAFLDSLPVAGVDGTLAHRMTSGDATGRAHLKTGTLADTRALAGYVRARSGQVYALAAVVNHASAPQATPVLDELVAWTVRQG